MFSTTNMDILLPKLLIQTLAQCPQAKLTRRDRTRHHISPPRRRRSRKQQRTPLALRIQFILLELKNRIPSKSKCSTDVCIQCFGYFGICDLEEGFPDSVPGVPKRYAEGCCFGGTEMGTDGLEGGCDCFRGVCGYRKGCRLDTNRASDTE